MRLELKVLKAILMLCRLGNRTSSKEEQVREQMEWINAGFMTEEDIDEWICSMRKDLNGVPCEEAEWEGNPWGIPWYVPEWDDGWDEEDDRYCPSCTAGDYGPGNPWDAPGMSIRDFL